MTLEELKKALSEADARHAKAMQDMVIDLHDGVTLQIEDDPDPIVTLGCDGFRVSCDPIALRDALLELCPLSNHQLSHMIVDDMIEITRRLAGGLGTIEQFRDHARRIVRLMKEKTDG